jgi:hypothetical protein
MLETNFYYSKFKLDEIINNIHQKIIFLLNYLCEKNIDVIETSKVIFYLCDIMELVTKLESELSSLNEKTDD